jgi:formylglycine-generating enzyme required for sulfatase activity
MGKAERHDAIRVFRGGSWFNPQANARVANRSGNGPGLQVHGLGVRFARRRTALELLTDEPCMEVVHDHQG